MPFDEKLPSRIATNFSSEPTLQSAFGGLSFLRAGRMCCGIEARNSSFAFSARRCHRSSVERLCDRWMLSANLSAGSSMWRRMRLGRTNGYVSTLLGAWRSRNRTTQLAAGVR